MQCLGYGMRVRLMLHTPSSVRLVGEDGDGEDAFRFLGQEGWSTAA